MKERITCEICKRTFEYEETLTTECLPDGYFVPGKTTWEWICDECGSCPECGISLEKEWHKRAHLENGILIPAQKCEDCEHDI